MEATRTRPGTGGSSPRIVDAETEGGFDEVDERESVEEREQMSRELESGDDEDGEDNGGVSEEDYGGEDSQQYEQYEQHEQQQDEQQQQQDEQQQDEQQQDEEQDDNTIEPPSAGFTAEFGSSTTDISDFEHADWTSRVPQRRLFVFKEGDGFASPETLRNAPTATARILMLPTSSQPAISGGSPTPRSASNRSSIAGSITSASTSSSRTSTSSPRRWSVPASISSVSSFTGLENGTDPSRRKGQSPVLRAASKGSLRLLKLQVRIFRVDVNERRGGSQQTPLHKAAAGGHEKVMGYILKHGGDMNAVDQDGRTPLHVAALRGSLGGIELICKRDATSVNTPDVLGSTPALLALRDGGPELSDAVIGALVASGADLFTTDNQGRNLLHYAIGNNHLHTVERLINDPNTRLKLCPQQDYEGNTPLHVATAMIARLDTIFDDNTRGVRERVLQALSSFEDVLSLVGRVNNLDNQTSYDLATEASKSVLRLSAERHIKAECNSLAGSCGSLLDAVQLGHIDCVKHAVKVCPNLNEPWRIHEKGGHGLLPIHVAVLYNRLDILDLLLRKERKGEEGVGGSCQLNLRVLPDATLCPSQMAVHIATNMNNLQALEVLARHKSNFNPTLIPQAPRSPLMIAIETTNLPLVETLLRCGASPSYGMINGVGGPLFIAIKRPNALPAIVTTLIDKGASNNEQQFGLAPIHTAVHHENPQLALDLLRALVDTKPRLDALTEDGSFTALQMTVWRQHAAMAKLLLDSGASTNVPGAAGLAPVTEDVLKSNDVLVNLLLSFKANVNLPNESPLLAAVQQGWLDTVDKLLVAGADPDQVLPEKEPAVFVAIRQRRIDIFYRLVAGGANLLLPNTPQGDHPVCLALTLAEDDDTAGQWIQAAVDALAKAPQQRENATIKPVLDTPDLSHRTPLGVAVVRRLPNTITSLISLGANASVLAKDGYSVLQHALGVVAGAPSDLVLAKQLIVAGADVNTTNNGLPLVYHATRTNQPKMLVLLLLSKADVNLRAMPFSDAAIPVGETALVAAARLLPDLGAAVFVKSLLQAGADGVLVDLVVERTSLHWAVFFGKPKTVSALLEFHKTKPSAVPLDAKDHDGKTVIHHAIDKKQVDMAQAFVNAGARVNDTSLQRSTYLQYIFEQHLNPQGEDYDVLVSLVGVLAKAGAPGDAELAPQPLWLACTRAGDNEDVAIKLSFAMLQNCKPINVNGDTNANGETALIRAMHQSRGKAVRLARLLLKYNANPDLLCGLGHSALGAACHYPEPASVHLLLTVGKADPTVHGVQDIDNMAVWIAATRDHRPVLAVLLGNKATQAFEITSLAPAHPVTLRTLAHVAAQGDDIQTLHLLFQRKANLLAVTAEAHGEETPLHTAMGNGSAQAVQYLALHGGIRPIKTMINARGQTPYDVASKDSVVVKTLADTVQKRLSVKCTCGSCVQAVIEGHLGCVQAVGPFLPLWMLENALVPDREVSCESLLITAVRHRRLGIAKFFIEGLGVNVDCACPTDGTTALHHAALVPAPTFTQVLLQSGAKVNVVDKENHTPLTVAAAAGPSHAANVIQLCNAKGSNINHRGGPDQQTALHLLASTGSLVGVSALLKVGANRVTIMQTTKTEGNTALHIAARSGNSQVVLLLLTRVNPLTDLEVANKEKKTCLEVACGDCRGVIERQVDMVHKLKANIRAETDAAASKLRQYMKSLQDQVQQIMKKLSNDHRQQMQARSRELGNSLRQFSQEVQQWAHREAQSISQRASQEAQQAKQQCQMTVMALEMEIQMFENQVSMCQQNGDQFGAMNAQTSKGFVHGQIRAAKAQSQSSIQRIKNHAHQEARNLPQQCRSKMQQRQNEIKAELRNHGNQLANQRAARSQQLKNWYREETAKEQQRLKGELDAVVLRLSNTFKVSRGAIMSEASQQMAASNEREMQAMQESIQQEQHVLQGRVQQEQQAHQQVVHRLQEQQQRQRELHQRQLQSQQRERGNQQRQQQNLHALLRVEEILLDDVRAIIDFAQDPTPSSNGFDALHPSSGFDVTQNYDASSSFAPTSAFDPSTFDPSSSFYPSSAFDQSNFDPSSFDLSNAFDSSGAFDQSTFSADPGNFDQSSGGFDFSSSFDSSSGAFDQSGGFDFSSSFDSSGAFDLSSAGDSSSFNTDFPPSGNDFDFGDSLNTSIDIGGMDFNDLSSGFTDMNIPDMSVSMPDISIPDMSFDMPNFDVAFNFDPGY